MPDLAWQELFKAEIARGEAARVQGLEGQARVYARRAAGVLLRQYAMQRGITDAPTSAFDMIRRFSDDPGLSPEVHEILRVLQLRMLPGGVTPFDQDLLQLVSTLPDLLLNS